MVGTLLVFFASATQLFAQQPPATNRAGQGTSEGNKIVAAAARRVQAEPSIQAQIRFRIDAAGQNLLGNGLYVQLGDGPEKLLRFDLKLHVGQRYYWVRRDLPPANHKVSRVNLRSVRQAIAKKHADDEKEADLGGLPTTSPADDAWLLMGGLPALLAGLEQNFDFSAPREGTIEVPGVNGGSAYRLPVWALSGQWKKERWDALTAGSGKNKKLPPLELPQRVDLVLGRNERSFALFPYRVVYYARKQSGAGEGAANVTPLVSMEFFNVQPAAELDPRDFDYNPGEQEVEDLTQAYLVKLGLVTK